MENKKKGIKVIILVGGEKRATRFRPLSLDIPKPLFPIGGKSMITHYIEACKQLEDLEEILILGSFDELKFQEYVIQQSKITGLKVR